MNNRITKTLRAKAGFTLVELIVVIAILGILAGVGTVGYSGYIKKANEAADQQLLGFVNQAFAAACAENGKDASNLDSVPTLTLTGDAGAKKVGTVSMYDDEFQRYLSGIDGVFKVISALYFDSVVHMFVASSGVYDGLMGVFSDTDIAAFNESYFATIGVSSLMNQVDMATQVALAADPNSTLGQMVYSDANIMGAIEYVGSEEALSDLILERAAQLAAANGGDTGDYELQAEQEILANYAVLVAATKTDFDTADFKAQLAAGNGKNTIKGSMDGETGNQTALAQTAMAYAMYTSYVTRNGGTATNDIFVVLDTLESDGFKTYMNTTEATADMDGYLAAMGMIESASSDKSAGSTLLVNGFTDPELIALLTQEISG